MTTDLIDVPYALTLTTRADGTVRVRVRGTRMRAAVALLIVCAAPALPLRRGEGWWSGGTGAHANALLPEHPSQAVADVRELKRRRYFAVSGLALVASLGIAACVLLAW
ncbi:hypothetical protein [Streptomyces sp. NPDC060184]|uniref:hypothetical protein n=1 Tax=Streptomyces sp. NPDC060184 TaxID=3347064 RepID=UPI00365A0F83